MKKIYIVGSLPPPVHGVTQINSFIISQLNHQNVKIICFNLSTGKLIEFNFQRFFRIFTFLKVLVSYIFIVPFQQKCSIYFGLSGGLGQLYEIFFIFIARILGFRIFLHHHSFNYLIRKKIYTQSLTFFSGYKATDIGKRLT